MKKLQNLLSELWKAVNPQNLDLLFDKVAKSNLSQKEKARLLDRLTIARIRYGYWLLFIYTLIISLVGYWLILHSGQIQLTLG